MSMVCGPCGKGVCNDSNLYRHRNDTPNSACKQCIKCDVPITSKKQIRSHMKSEHKDVECGSGTCNKKFYLAGARDQHKRDVHGGQTSVPSGQVQHKRHSRQASVASGPAQHKRDSRQAIVATGQVQHKRDSRQAGVASGPVQQKRDSRQNIVASGPVQQKRDSRQASVPSGPVQQKRDSRQAGVASWPVQQNRDSRQASVASGQVQHKLNSRQSIVPSGPVQQNRDSRQAIVASGQVQQKLDSRQAGVASGPVQQKLNSRQSIVPSRPVQQKLNSRQASVAIGQVQQEKDGLQASGASVPVQQKREARSDKADLPKKQDLAIVQKLPETTVSRRQDIPQQPRENTRFLTDLKLSGNSLKRLLDEKVRQDPNTMKRCKEVVHHLVNFMQNNLDCGVSEVVKGGSLGKGTSIREKVDIDLVVFMNRFKSVSDLQENHREVMKDMKKHILKDFTFAKQIHYSYDTKHSNRFSIRTDDGKGLIPVDLLPAYNTGGGSKSTFREMAGLSEEAKSYYSVSFVKDQVRFTRDKPEAVKDCTRIVKHWKTREKLNVPSYTTEILTSKEWERMGKPPQPDLDQLFKRTMTQLSDMDRIKVAWPNSRYTGNRPIVMDPANPFNNTVSTITSSDQEEIEKKAREVVTWL